MIAATELARFCREPIYTKIACIVIVSFITGITHQECNAQQYVGIEGGYSNYSEHHVERNLLPSNISPSEVMVITGLSSGIVKGTYNHMMSKTLGMHGAVGYGMIGSRNTIPHQFEHVERRFSVLYTEAALTGQINTGRIQPTGRIGLRFNYAFDLREDFIYRSRDGITRQALSPELTTSRTHFSAIGAVGLAWNISSKVRILALGEYAIAVTSITQEEIYGSKKWFDRYPRNISALIGTQFAL